MESAKSEILIIDDEIHMRFYLMTLVKSLGFKPVLAENGVKGLDMLTRMKPSAIILDIMMPEKGGSSVYKELKANPGLKDIPVIFFSGVDREAFFHHIKMLNLEAQDSVPEPGIYVAKDADPEYLLEVIKKAVNGTISNNGMQGLPL